MRKKSYEIVELRKSAPTPCKNCTKIYWFVSDCKKEGAEIEMIGIKIESCTGFEDYRDKTE